MQKLSVDHSERFCVFQCGEQWFGVSSSSIRSVVPRPTITPTPFSDPILRGICHVRNEFVPALSLRALMNIEMESLRELEAQLMLMIGPQGHWGLLIDRAVALTPVETSISTIANGDEGWSRVIIGSASHANHILQILDPSSMYQYASKLIGDYWPSDSQPELESASEESTECEEVKV